MLSLKECVEEKESQKDESKFYHGILRNRRMVRRRKVRYGEQRFKEGREAVLSARIM